LRALTNLRVVPDAAVATEYRIEPGPFPGCAKFPEGSSGVVRDRAMPIFLSSGRMRPRSGDDSSLRIVSLRRR
jgi:hypothetical protein